MSNKNEIEVLKEKLAQKEAEMKAQKEALKAKMEELKAQAKALAKSLKAQGQGAKRNLTEEIRQAMLKGKTVDQMVQELKVERKAILDRRWLIEKKAGLR